MTSKMGWGFCLEWVSRGFAILVAAVSIHGCNSGSGSAARMEFISVCQQNCDVEISCRAQAGQATFDRARCKDVCMTGAASDCPNVAGLTSHAKGCIALECSAYLSCIEEPVSCDLAGDAAQPSHD